jgi:glycosyltransferase involved in cell wall biosynthesis
MTPPKPTISVVTPTFYRPEETLDMLENLSKQKLLPNEVIIVDGAPSEEIKTEEAVKKVIKSYPFNIIYIRHEGGTAIQRNVGIDNAKGDFVAFVDDDIRLETDFLQNMISAFNENSQKKVGGITGYITNQYFDPNNSQRWRWYKKLKLFKTYTPGHYDFKTGIPINRYTQPPHHELREIHFMGAGCAVWRREVFDEGIRFSRFFSDYGVLEDAHMALCAGKNWNLLENGNAKCIHLRAPGGRPNHRRIGYKSIVNYYYVFQDLVNPLTLGHKFRFWRFQTFEFFRIGTSVIRRRQKDDIQNFIGRVEGVFAVIRGVSK